MNLASSKISSGGVTTIGASWMKSWSGFSYTEGQEKRSKGDKPPRCADGRFVNRPLPTLPLLPLESSLQTGLTCRLSPHVLSRWSQHHSALSGLPPWSSSHCGNWAECTSQRWRIKSPWSQNQVWGSTWVSSSPWPLTVLFVGFLKQNVYTCTSWMDREAWELVHGATESDTTERLSSSSSMHMVIYIYDVDCFKHLYWIYYVYSFCFMVCVFWLQVVGFLGGAVAKNLPGNARSRFIPWVGLKLKPVPVFLPGKFHRQIAFWKATVHAKSGWLRDWAHTYGISASGQDRTSTACIGSGSLIHWTAKKVPVGFFRLESL